MKANTDNIPRRAPASETFILILNSWSGKMSSWLKLQILALAFSRGGFSVQNKFGLWHEKGEP